METAYITHPACALHDMGGWHPESPDRLDAINDQLRASGMLDWLACLDARPADDAALRRVHDADYLAWLQALAPAEGGVDLDGDTRLTPHTLAAAAAAAGAGITAVDAVINGDCRSAFCAVRPPGHHANRNRAMGFCFYNNVAVAAAHALARHGLQRVAIIDFDIHHGNGTEDIFAGDERVLFCGVHQPDCFPFRGPQPSAPNIVNVPLPRASDGEALRAAVSRVWLPRLRAHAPELLLVSAGFDGHREDDMGQWLMSEADYGWVTAEAMAAAEASSGGRVVSLLEGGYALSALGRSVVAHVRALARL